jgi:hypothetical protein
MAESTSRLLQWYYNHYQSKEILFTKEVISALRINMRQTAIKGSHDHYFCIINSTSLKGATIVVGSATPALAMLKKERGTLGLRYSFIQASGKELSFFVTAKVGKIGAYGDTESLSLVPLTFVQQPPDDLIEIIGRCADTQVQSESRKEERIPFTQDVRRKMSLLKEENAIYLQNATRRCMLRDIAFSGARLVLLDTSIVPQVGEAAALRFVFDDLELPVDVPGVVTAVLPVEGTPDLMVLTVHYIDSNVPLAYKLHVNNGLPRKERR